MAATAQWILASPWYRSDSVTGRRRGPGCGGPIVQKYATSDPVTPFLAEPQSSLRFTGDDLTYHLFGRRHEVLDADNRGREPLKLFQPLHARFYLVVCELFCRVPGWPAVPREQVCEAGFVVRRKVPDVTEGQLAVLIPLFAQKRSLLHRGEYLTTRFKADHPDPGDSVEDRLGKLIRNTGSQAARNKLDDLKEQLAENQALISEALAGAQIQNRTEGWLASEHPGIGGWSADIEAEPQDLGREPVYPLFPLTPDPTLDGHTGAGSSLNYGLIPTHSNDIDGDDAPRFDDRSLYFISCFVRRHRGGCARTATRGDCPGELVWSLPTESYRLASPYDLDGTSNRPVNIRLPDLDALQAHAQRSGPGGSVGARFDVPPGSALMMKTNQMDMPEKIGSDGRGDQVCFFAIPLITLVALFLLNIFLPILLFLFNLWFMLKLKLCIPPSIEIDADLAAELDIEGPSIEAELELNASFEIEIGGDIFSGGGGQASVDDVKTALKNEMVLDGELDPLHLDDNTIQGLKDEIDADLDNAVDLVRTMGADITSESVAGEAGTLANGSRGLVYFLPEDRA